MPARTRITRTSCGRWEVRTRGGDSAVLPTRALAEDYASAVETEEDPPAKSWSRRHYERFALTLSASAVALTGSAWALNVFAVDHPSFAPAATIAGSVALAIRTAVIFRG